MWIGSLYGVYVLPLWVFRCVICWYMVVDCIMCCGDSLVLLCWFTSEVIWCSIVWCSLIGVVVEGRLCVFFVLILLYIGVLL